MRKILLTLAIIFSTNVYAVELKGKLIKINCDVMNFKDLNEKLKKIKIIDILVNNAGTNIPEPFEKLKQ